MKQEDEIQNHLPPNEQIRLLEERREELLPVIAEVRRIEGRLQALRAWMDERDGKVKSRKQYPTELRVLQVLQLVEGKPGVRKSELARTLGLTPSRVGLLVKLAVASGDLEDLGRDGLRLTRQGERRAREIHPEQPEVIVSASATSATERAAGGDGEGEH